MITLQDYCHVYEALAAAKRRYFWYNPSEVFGKVRWDGVHWKNVVHLAQHQEWVDMKEYMKWMGETYLREHMQTLIQMASPRLYRTLWGEHVEPSEKEPNEKVKMGEHHLEENPV